MKQNKNYDEMNEAYKMLDGAPSATGVSDAAKGIHPKKDKVQYRIDTENQNERLYEDMDHDEEGKQLDPSEKRHPQSKCKDIDEAYSMLFEALAIITKK
jgi:hypothetical protein